MKNFTIAVCFIKLYPALCMLNSLNVYLIMYKILFCREYNILTSAIVKFTYNLYEFIVKYTLKKSFR